MCSFSGSLLPTCYHLCIGNTSVYSFKCHLSFKTDFSFVLFQLELLACAWHCETRKAQHNAWLNVQWRACDPTALGTWRAPSSLTRPRAYLRPADTPQPPGRLWAVSRGTCIWPGALGLSILLLLLLLLEREWRPYFRRGLAPRRRHRRTRTGNPSHAPSGASGAPPHAGLGGWQSGRVRSRPGSGSHAYLACGPARGVGATGSCRCVKPEARRVQAGSVGPGHWQRSGTSDPGTLQAPRCPLRVWVDLAPRLGPVYPQHRRVPS